MMRPDPTTACRNMMTTLTTKRPLAPALSLAAALLLVPGLGDSARADLIAWFDGDDLDADGMSEDSGEEGLVADAVQTWADKAPEANSAGDATASGDSQPAYTTSGGLGDRSHPTFDGINDFMQSPLLWNAVFSAAGDDYTSFLVFRSSGSSGAFDIMWSDAGAPQTQVNMDGTAGGKVRGRINGGTQDLTTNSYSDGAGHVVMMGVDTGSGTYLVDGTEDLPITIGVNLVGGGPGLRLGGLGPSGGNNFSGDIAEFILFDHALTEDEQIGMQSLIGQKWGFTTVEATEGQRGLANALFQGSQGTDFYLGDDGDGDGMPDTWEDDNGLNKNNPDDAGEDILDNDGLTNLEEFQNGTDPNDDDSDDDTLKDGHEVKTLGTNPLSDDTDGDTLLDQHETNTGNFVDAMDTGTDPTNDNTDGDRFTDGEEVANGTDPTDPDDPPGSGALLLAWFDGDDLDADGLAEGSGEEGIVADAVETWADKSPEATSAGDATVAGASQPAFVAAGLGGRSHPSFDGSDDFMQSPFAWNVAFSANGDPFTSFVVFRSGGSSGAFDIMWSDAGAPQNQVNMDGSGAVGLAGSVRGRTYGGSQNSTAGPFTDNAGHVIMMGTNGGVENDPSFFIVDGSVQIPPDPGNPDTNPTGIDIGPNLVGGGIGLRIGGLDGTGNNNFTGDVAEVILFDKALSNAERIGLQHLIGRKWGFDTILASGAQIDAANALFVGSQGTDVYLDVTPFVLNEVSYLPGSNELVIKWDSKGGRLYNLRSETDPSASAPIDWPILGTNADIAATPPENTLTIPLPPEPVRFLVVEAFPAPPVEILATDFESGLGDWTVGSDGAPGTAWELGAPTGGGPPAANSPTNCFGTNIGGDYDFDANVFLRSPEIDLTTAGGATLSYFQFRDIEESFDAGTVRVLDADNDSELAVLEATVEGSSNVWEKVTKALPAAALGKSIKLEFRLTSDDVANQAGWYIDDFTVTVP